MYFCMIKHYVVKTAINGIINGDCVESGSGFFVLHRDVNEGGNTAMQLSRIVSLSPRTFLASYHAEDTSLLTCIRIAVKNQIL